LIHFPLQFFFHKIFIIYAYACLIFYDRIVATETVN